LEHEWGLRSIFQAYAEYRKRHRKMNEFEYLDPTPYLHSSEYLRELYRGADTNEKKQKLLDYIQRFEVNDKEFKGYYSLYEQIGRELGYIEDEEYIQIPKSLIAEYARQMMDDEDFVKYNMRGQRK
jgi:thioredoxin-related protein